MRLPVAAAATVTVPAHPDTRFAAGMAATETINVRGLEQHLRRHVAGEVRFDRASLAMYANDSSNFRQVPIGVVVPRTLDDVVATHRACAPLSAHRSSTAAAAPACPGETVNYAVVIDFSKYLTEIGDVDVDRAPRHRARPG